jgi:hypothetical protein
MNKNELKQLIREAISEIVDENSEGGSPLLDINKIHDIEVDNVNRGDYPDFVDAYPISATIECDPSHLTRDAVLNNGKWYRSLTDDELEWLGNEHPDLIQKAAMDSLHEGGKKKKWIQKATNPKHAGYCSPMTKSTCTPARKALALRFKKGI